MIVWLLGAFLLAGMSFSILSILTKNVLVRGAISILLMLIAIGLGLFLLSRIDTPPAGSHPFTQEELEKASGIEDGWDPLLPDDSSTSSK